MFWNQYWQGTWTSKITHYYTWSNTCNLQTAGRWWCGWMILDCNRDFPPLLDQIAGHITSNPRGRYPISTSHFTLSECSSAPQAISSVTEYSAMFRDTRSGLNRRGWFVFSPIKVCLHLHTCVWFPFLGICLLGRKSHAGSIVSLFSQCLGLFVHQQGMFNSPKLFNEVYHSFPQAPSLFPKLHVPKPLQKALHVAFCINWFLQRFPPTLS